MRRPPFAILATVVLTIGVPLAHAITNGEPDGTAHPYVGLVGFYDAGGAYVQRCSGTLITPDVVLTAAHCAFADDGVPLREARVWFEPVVGPGVVSGKVGGAPGGATPHPGFDALAALPQATDVAVVVLDDPVAVSSLGELPAVGALDGLKKKDVSFTLVGYGYEQLKPVEVTGDRTRRRTTARLAGLKGGSATTGSLVATKPGKGGGTFCLGDSGGPVLLEGSNVVVGVSSAGKGTTCEKEDVSVRTDTAAFRTWLGPYLG
jgi:Trypsin